MTHTDKDGRETYRLGSWIIREDWPLWLLLAAALVAAVVLYPSLPERMPTHWNIRGEVDRWGSRAFGAFGTLAITAGVYVMLLVMPLVDPGRANYPKFASTYRILRSVLVVFMTALWGVTLAAAKGTRVDVGVMVPVLVSLLFILFGNLMGRLRYNWFVGIRTPWSLANEEAWRRTHRVGGRAWVLGGLVSLAGALAGHKVAAWTMGLGIGAAAVFSVVYSYFAWRQTQEGGKG